MDNAAECPGQLEQGVGPRPGDISICFYCNTPLIFKEDMSLRELDLNDALQLGSFMNNIIRYQKLIRENTNQNELNKPRNDKDSSG
jgi:hypothetical protein